MTVINLNKDLEKEVRESTRCTKELFTALAEKDNLVTAVVVVVDDDDNLSVFESLDNPMAAVYLAEVGKFMAMHEGVVPHQTKAP